jgi:hypothetical protein
VVRPRSQKSARKVERNPHETRGAALLLCGQQQAAAQEQVPLLRHSLFIDLVFDAREVVPPTLLPFSRFIAGRRVVVELESATLSAGKLRRHLAEPLLLPPEDDPDEGVLLVFCRQIPLARLDYYEAMEVEPGVWQLTTGRRGSAYIVVPDQLPVAPGYALLRMLFATNDEAEARRRADHLLTDGGLPSDVRDECWRRIHDGEVPMSYEELAHLGMREFHEASVRIGEERGEQRGRQEGAVQASLALAERLLPAEEVAALQALPPEQVLDAVAARLRPR